MERIGRYRIIGELGRGAMGVVYHAEDPNIGRSVAIKTIKLGEVRNEAEQTKLRERLFREARSAGSLSHPGIVTIYDVEEAGEMAWIAMEYVDGPTLDELLSREAAIRPEQMFSILGQTAVALDYAHQKGIVHRDIKPANIMIASDGTAKITDFGIAKITASEQFTMTGSIVGTPHYMSPEQVQGKPVDGRSDQFSLGVIVYEMLTGEKPFTGEHLTTVVFKIVAEEFPAPRRMNPTVSPEIEAVLKRALAKKPEQRFRTCNEFIQALETACQAAAGWKTMVRGGSLQMPTVADAPRPQVTLPPAKKPRRATDTATSPREEVEKKSGFLPFLAAILVAAGLLAVIGWQAAPWIAEQQAARQAKLQPAPETKPPEIPPAVQTPPAAVAPAPEEEKRPSPLDPPERPAASADDKSTPEAAAVSESKPQRQPERPARPQTENRSSAVSVLSSPAGATASIDGRPEISCTTPCTLEVPQGRHALSVRMAGRQTEMRDITVSGSAQELPLITLRAPTGTLMVSSAPAGANIIINGKRWNQPTPAQIPLPPGNYSVTVEKDGRQSSKSVDVKNGAINYLKVTLE